MQRLKVLEDAELVIVRRKGRERWNHLNPLPISTSTSAGSAPTAAHARRASRSLENAIWKAGNNRRLSFLGS